MIQTDTGGSPDISGTEFGRFGLTISLLKFVLIPCNGMTYTREEWV